MSDDMPTGEKLAKSAQPAVTALPEAEITRLTDEIVSRSRPSTILKFRPTSTRSV